MSHKRLIVCCDGTWNQPDNEHITNIEKIARTVQSSPRKTGGVYQLVYYIGGVGGRRLRADRVLGGALAWVSSAHHRRLPVLAPQLRAGRRYLHLRLQPWRVHRPQSSSA